VIRLAQLDHAVPHWGTTGRLSGGRDFEAVSLGWLSRSIHRSRVVPHFFPKVPSISFSIRKSLYAHRIAALCFDAHTARFKRYPQATCVCWQGSDHKDIALGVGRVTNGSPVHYEFLVAVLLYFEVTRSSAGDRPFEGLHWVGAASTLGLLSQWNPLPFAGVREDTIHQSTS
jgi:hypothetical protein